MSLEAVASYYAHMTPDENCNQLNTGMTNNIILSYQQSGGESSLIPIAGCGLFGSPVINLMVGYELPRSGEQRIRPTS